jgi:hypothetical protein
MWYIVFVTVIFVIVTSKCLNFALFPKDLVVTEAFFLSYEEL